MNSVLKTNAPVSSAIRWLHLSQQRYKTNQNTISLEQRIDSLTNELTKLTEEQHKIINLLHDLSNRSSVSIIPQ